jgi:hypothetical protein
MIIQNFLSLLFFLSLVFFGNSCQSQDSDTSSIIDRSKAFNAYWYDGKAEISRYELSQVRYGENHKGDAVMIFVSEEFRGDKHVKYEGGNRKNVVPILKLNQTRKFNTGIYPYSMMTSTFTPIDGSSTLKTTTTSQEWCGHTFTQINLNGKKYKGRLFSYFQEEGDQTFTLDDVLLEDEIWTLLRLNPEAVPTGYIDVVPGSQFLRFKHRPTQVEKAQAMMMDFEGPDGKRLKKYRLEYLDFDRVLEISFESSFPYTIESWTETMRSGPLSSTVMKTTAKKTHSMKSAYWNKNSVSDSPLRKELGLD